MKRLGPDLKFPDLSKAKVPGFVTDVYYDLRDRRLLPLIALVVVSIVAVPFLLASEPESLMPPPLTQSEDGGTAGAASFAVVEAKPGLRAPGKRLGSRSATNPFKQRYTGLPKGAGLEITSSSSASASGGGEGATIVAEDEVVEDLPAPDAPSGGGGGSGGSSPGQTSPSSPTESGLRFFSFRPDVRFGVAGSGDLILHEDLDVGRVLPKENPVIVFVGVSEDGKRAAFDVAHEVTEVRGEGHCIGGKQNCSLLMLRTGEAADLVTATPGREFRLKVEKIEFVEVERPDPVKRKQSAGASRAARTPSGFVPVQSFSK